MGRGLSELQKNILTLAYRNHATRGLADPLYRVRATYPFILDEEVPYSIDVDEFTSLLNAWMERVEPQVEQLLSPINDALRCVEEAHRCTNLRQHGGLIDWVLKKCITVEFDGISAQEDAATIATMLTETGFDAKSYLLGQQDLKIYSVMVYDDPGTCDLRAIVPEAFTKPWPDGLWLPAVNHAYLVAGTFLVHREAEAFASTLGVRGLSVSKVTSPDFPGWDATFAELMVANFGASYRTHYTPPPDDFPRAAITRELGTGIDRVKMGANAYTAAAVSISRAMDRMESRGLINKMGYQAGARWRDCSIALTNESLDLVKELSANTRSDVISVSRYEEAA